MGAKEATRRTREREHADKLALARKAISKYNPKRTSKDWRTWTIDYCQELEISQKWLTRAIHKGELQPPSKKEGHHAKG